MQKETEEEQAIQRRMRIEDFADQLLTGKRDVAISFRASSGVERRWREDEAAYDGNDGPGQRSGMMDYANGDKFLSSQYSSKRRSKVIINVTRSRTDTAAGRFCDIILPTSESNFLIEATPVPELSDARQDKRPAMQEGVQVQHDDGTPAVMGDFAKEISETAKKAADLMQLEISDQLLECNCNGECRKVVRDATKTGTGVLKGPCVIKDIKRSWRESRDGDSVIHEMEITEGTTPVSKWVSHWNVYPSSDCKEDFQKCSYIWEKDTILPREVRALIGLPGYDTGQLMLVLEEEPKRVTAVSQDTSNGQTWIADYNTVEKGLAYEIWEYTGDVNKDDLIALGCDCGEDSSSMSAVVVFINDRAVRVELNILDSGAMPYDGFQWGQQESSPWGIGIPRMMMWPQKVVINAWRAMMDNAGDSSGANLVIGEGIEPDDGIMEVTGKKIWISTADSSSDDVRKGFAQFQLQNNQPGLQAVIDLALRFVDIETSIPAIFQGEAKELPETLGATNIMVDSANIAFRKRVQIWDDQITKPHISRYYNFNMQYGENNESKGDYKVIPTGVSVLYERDQEAQLLINSFSMKSDPDVNREVDWEKATKQYFKSVKLDILKTPEQLEEYDEKMKNQPPPVAPQLEVAQVRVEGDLQKAQMNQSSDMAELEFKASDAERARQFEMKMKEMDFQMTIMKLMQEKDMNLDDIKAMLASDTMKLNTQKEMAGVAQVTTPLTEPPGRARDGHAYEE